MDYLVAVLLPQLLHGLVFGAALGLLALGLTVIFGLLGVMNFAHGELYMLGAYAGIAVVGVTHSFWVALILAPLLVAALGAVTEIATLRPIYRGSPCTASSSPSAWRSSSARARARSGAATCAASCRPSRARRRCSG